ncbi:AhpC/TSA family protein [Flavobacterium jejuense]|uniref:thioredoxin-dependent peroxiredoxin n=1 Tax=Flavobacterium jejuense TaxID=1544455 RepID=A0ABX0IS25_9FLAO|nr:peroxiredoxin-like family protein [Flavobacterium jejuense]NHN26582.1 AhpC/TSA family protein [Flavobacterium jejuense]
MKKVLTVVLFSLSFAIQAQMADKPENVSPLLIGEKIPNIKLQDIKGKEVETNTLLDKKTVLIVYRGGWCPYCNAQLADMQEIEQDILSLGYQIVAVSPDSPSFLKETEDKGKLGYMLFSDSNGVFSKALGIAFTAPEKYGKVLSNYSGGKNTNWLPVPTVYVLNEKQEIEFMYINPDYSKRLNGNLLLSVLKTL